MAVEKKTLNLVGSKKPTPSKPKATKEPTDKDENLFDGVKPSKGASPIVAGACIGVAVIAVIVGFFVVKGLGDEVDEPIKEVQDAPPITTTTPPQAQTSLGFKDFTDSTNMVSDSNLSNPDTYVEDLYGLTTVVNYTVLGIRDSYDFVSYEKKRGTWGGGLELYWLEAEYKGSKYSIQVPFKYYKELDASGIVPVRMEVLEVKGSTSTETLTVVSYMCLDEKVLESVLKNQGK